MPMLLFADQERAKNHLGYTSRAVPLGDGVIFRAALYDNDRTVEWIAWAVKLLNRCDRTFDESETDAQDSGIASRRVLTGDRNYSDIEYRPPSQKERDRAYIAETDRLARFLGATNYNNPDNYQFLNVSAMRQ